ncbi:MAG: YybH family protein [Nevskiales bacterium]
MTFVSRVGTVAAAGAVLLFGVACSDRQKEVSGEIGVINQQFMTALAAGDGSAIAALYTEDGQLLPPASPPITGRQAIAGFWQGGINAGIKGASLKTTEAEGHGDTAHEVGEYRMLAADGSEIDAGKYIVLWKRVEGQWKLHRDIWNTNRK